jgi:hypothetical protein
LKECGPQQTDHKLTLSLWVSFLIIHAGEEIEPSQGPEQTPPQPISATDVSPELSSNRAEPEREDAEARWQAWVGEFFQAKEQGTEVEE